MNDTNGPQPIEQLVRRASNLLLMSKVAAGWGMAAGLLLGTMVVVGGLDILLPLETWQRLLALLAVLLPAAVVFALFFVRPLLRPESPTQVARKIESRLPGISNRLVSCLDLFANPYEHQYSPAFFERLLRETNQWIAGFRPRTLIDQRRLLWAAVVGLGGLLLFEVTWLSVPQRFSTAMVRIFRPWADIPPATDVAFSVEPGSVELLRGDDLTFTAHVEKGAPETLRLELHNSAGGLWRYPMIEQKPREWSFTLKGLEQSFSYRVAGGETWTKWSRVTVVERPALLELHTVLHYPAYLGDTEPVIGQSQEADVTGPADGAVEVVAEVKGNIARGEIQHLTVTTNSAPVVTKTFPMQALTNGAWAGKFPLISNGYYRVEFRDRFGHPNKPMTPGRFVAVADAPPQIRIERPGTDLVMSAPGKVPLSIAVSDDLGLADVTLLFHRSDTNAFTSRLLKQYTAPSQGDMVAAVLDLASLNLKIGEAVTYRAEVRDRKGQTTSTKEYVVRLAADEQAADRRASEFQTAQETIGKRLVKLTERQDAVRVGLNDAAARYAPLLVKIEGQLGDVRPAPGMFHFTGDTNDVANLATNAAALKLDPESARQLEALWAKLSMLAANQEKNAQMARAFAEELGKLSQQAAAAPVVPYQMGQQLTMLQQAFAQMALSPMQNLAGLMGTKGTVPDLDAMRQLSEQLQGGLNQMSSRFGEMREATDLMANDPNAAIAQLQNQMLLTQAGMAEHQLQQVHDLMGNMLSEMERLQGAQQQLAATTTNQPAAPLEALAQQQAKLDEQIKPMLDQVQELQAADRLRRLQNEPTFPAEPYVPGMDEYPVPPKEADTPEDEPHSPAPAKAKPGDQSEEEQEPPLYLPALGGPQPKVDPHFADQYRPAPPSSSPIDPTQRRREELQSRQWHRLEELDLAQQSVASDRQAVNSLAQQLEQTLQTVQSGNLPAGQTPQQMLAGQLRSQSLQQAMAMAARTRHWPSLGGAYSGGGWSSRQGYPVAGNLPELDVNTRTVLLNMQPQLREELLEGMREDGPEAYRPFIQNYFKQLSKVKNPQ